MRESFFFFCIFGSPSLHPLLWEHEDTHCSLDDYSATLEAPCNLPHGRTRIYSLGLRTSYIRTQPAETSLVDTQALNRLTAQDLATCSLESAWHSARRFLAHHLATSSQSSLPRLHRSQESKCWLDLKSRTPRACIHPKPRKSSTTG